VRARVCRSLQALFASSVFRNYEVMGWGWCREQGRRCSYCRQAERVRRIRHRLSLSLKYRTEDRLADCGIKRAQYVCRLSFRSGCVQGLAINSPGRWDHVCSWSLRHASTMDLPTLEDFRSFKLRHIRTSKAPLPSLIRYIPLYLRRRDLKGLSVRPRLEIITETETWVVPEAARTTLFVRA
jgi:hypothetical protein